MQKKIASLTQEQERQLISYRQEWLDIGYSTKPIDLTEVEEAIANVYELIGEQKPIIVYCQSPWQMCAMPEGYKAISKCDLSNLASNLGSNLRSNLRSNLERNLATNLERNLWSNLRTNLWTNLRTNLWRNLETNLERNLRSNLRSNLERNLTSNLVTNLASNLWSNLASNLESNLESAYADNYYWLFQGAWGLYWLAFYEFPEKFIPEFNYSEADSNAMQKWIRIAKCLAGFVPYKNICFVSDRPIRLTLDAQNRLHNESQAALEYSDGYVIYAWHGVMVPEYIIKEPEKITADLIDKESNQEIKRVMIERFGLENYVKSGTKIHQDDFGTLYQKKVEGTDLTLTMVHVVNGSREPDGTYKDYFLEVHPELCPMYENGKLGKPQEMTAKNAVASTYGLRGDQYCVTVRT